MDYGRQAKRDGHAAEHSAKFHDVLKEHFGFSHVTVDGQSTTKTDFMGHHGDTVTRFSGKCVKGKSTQVWLPTQRTLFIHVPSLKAVERQLIQWLGTVELRRQSAQAIDDWSAVTEAFDRATADGSLIEPMMLRAGAEDPVQFITWTGKHGGLTIIDATRYIEYIKINSRWETSPGGTTLHLKDINSGQTLVHLQRKGSGTAQAKVAPLFHIHRTWPKDMEVYHDPGFVIDLMPTEAPSEDEWFSFTE